MTLITDLLILTFWAIIVPGLIVHYVSARKKLKQQEKELNYWIDKVLRGETLPPGKVGPKFNCDGSQDS